MIWRVNQVLRVQHLVLYQVVREQKPSVEGKANDGGLE